MGSVFALHGLALTRPDTCYFFSALPSKGCTDRGEVDAFNVLAQRSHRRNHLLGHLAARAPVRQTAQRSPHTTAPGGVPRQ